MGWPKLSLSLPSLPSLHKVRMAVDPLLSSVRMPRLTDMVLVLGFSLKFVPMAGDYGASLAENKFEVHGIHADAVGRWPFEALAYAAILIGVVLLRIILESTIIFLDDRRLLKGGRETREIMVNTTLDRQVSERTGLVNNTEPANLTITRRRRRCDPLLLIRLFSFLAVSASMLILSFATNLVDQWGATYTSESRYAAFTKRWAVPAHYVVFIFQTLLVTVLLNCTSLDSKSVETVFPKGAGIFDKFKWFNDLPHHILGTDRSRTLQGGVEERVELSAVKCF